MEGSYLLNNQFGHPHNLERLDVSVGRETLGVHIAMDGNQDDQVISLENKSKDYAAKIMASRYNQNTAVYSYNRCFMKSLEYCMPVMSISKAQWTKIVKPGKQRALQKAGISLHFPNQVLYGPTKYGGYNYRNPYTLQGTEKSLH